METKNLSSNSIIQLTINPPLHFPKFRRFYESGETVTPKKLHKKGSYGLNRKIKKESMSSTPKSDYKTLSRQLFSKPFISSSSWVIINANNNKVLDSKNEDEIREIASLTKIMTCLTAIQEINKRNRSYEELIFVSEKAATIDGTSAGLQLGDQVKVWDLLHGLMLPSGNDAAMAISEFIGKMIDSENDPVDNFVQKMNANASFLKLDETVFNNPHGMSTSINVSTAKNIAHLASYAMKTSIFNRIVATKKHSCTIFNPIGTRKIEWNNTNLLLDKGFSGCKTGITPAAGPCLCFSTGKNKKKIIGVLLNSKTADIRWNEALKLWKYAHSNLF